MKKVFTYSKLQQFYLNLEECSCIAKKDNVESVGHTT